MMFRSTLTGLVLLALATPTLADEARTTAPAGPVVLDLARMDRVTAGRIGLKAPPMLGTQPGGTRGSDRIGLKAPPMRETQPG